MRKFFHFFLFVVFLTSFVSVLADNEARRVYTIEIIADIPENTVFPGVPVRFEIQSFPDQLDNSYVTWSVHDSMGFSVDEVAVISDDGVLQLRSSAPDGAHIIVEASCYNQWMTKISDEMELTVRNVQPTPTPPAPAAQLTVPDETALQQYGPSDGSIIIRDYDAGMPGSDISGKTVSINETHFVLYADDFFDNGIRKLNFDWFSSDSDIAHVDYNYGSNIGTVVFTDEGEVTISVRDGNDYSISGSVTLRRTCRVEDITLYEITSAHSGETIPVYGHTITAWDTVKQLRGRNILWSASVNGKADGDVTIKTGSLNDLFPEFIAADLTIGETILPGDYITVSATAMDDPSVHTGITFRIIDPSAAQPDRTGQPYMERVICMDFSEEPGYGQVCQEWVRYDLNYDSAAQGSTYCANRVFRQITAKECDRLDSCAAVPKMAYICL